MTKRKAKDGTDRGRPAAKIDWDTVKKLCSLQCTGEEIASFFEVHYDTLVRHIQAEFDVNFAEFYAQHSGPGKISLRRMQWKAAEAGNVRMLEWLGKQHLGQSDKRELSGNSGGPVELKVTQFEAEALENGG